MPKGPSKTKYDTFISYNSEDKPIADAICNCLESKKIRCFIVPRDVIPGTPFEEAIMDGIGNCAFFIIVYSRASNSSAHVSNEVRLAWSRGIPIIPIRIADVPMNNVLDYYIGHVHWIDAITPPLESHIEMLANAIQMLLSERR